MGRVIPGRARRALVALGAAAVALGVTPAAADQPQTYQAGDHAQGRILSVLPPGANGRVTAADVQNGGTPPHSNDQLQQYAGLIYGASGLTDAQLSTYYNDESFGVRHQDITSTENPGAGGTYSVTIYRDGKGIPHIYGADMRSMSFGAGYAAGEDRLFLVDVLRHLGAGRLAQFLGPSCGNEQMDHDQLLVAAYSDAQKKQQIDALPAEYGDLGTQLRDMVYAYVDGLNAYVDAAVANPLQLMPAEYAALDVDPTSVPPKTPQHFTVSDITDIASLVGGIFGKGGGVEARGAALYRYLQNLYGGNALAVFHDLREQNDADAPTTIRDRAFPYEPAPSSIDPTVTAIPDSATLTGGPQTFGTPDSQCTGKPPSFAIPTHLDLAGGHSNALLVDAAHSADRHPIAVLGPQVGYFGPQILMQEDMHAPGFDAAGASFPGTNFIVELGRGQDYAWSATSAGTDNVDQRAERICQGPGENGPQPQGTFYVASDGTCTAMLHQTFSDYALVPGPGGPGVPAVVNRDVYYTVHGGVPSIVQGWTTVDGRPVAISVQRSTYAHEADSGVGFLRWAEPALTHDAASWFLGAEAIQYTFNWFYVDDHDIAYYVSGRDPIRAAAVEPGLPAWGDGHAEWQGFLADDAHPHEINPPSGFFTSWNNKPAPQFSAADDQYGYGPIYRSLSLDEQIAAQFAAHPDGITRADLVTAMETAATVDLTGAQVLRQLLPYLDSSVSGLSSGASAMVGQLRAWNGAGAHRRKASPGDSQYLDAAAVAAMDDLWPRLVEAVLGKVLQGGGTDKVDGVDYDYTLVPQLFFADTPNGAGAHHGSSYDAGYEGYVVKLLRMLRGQAPGTPFSAALQADLCGSSGLSGCPGAIRDAVNATYTALAAANGSGDPSTWTQSTALHNANSAQPPGSSPMTMPQYDDIQFTQVSLVAQPAIDWQNRPTFQQVAEFPDHRPRGAVQAVTSSAAGLPNTAEGPAGGAAAILLVAGGALVARRRRRAAGPVRGSPGR